MPVAYVTSPLVAKVPADTANTYVWPAGRVVPAGTVARALVAGGVLLLEPQSCQPPIATAAVETLRISIASSLPEVMLRKATWEITTGPAACAAGAATAARTSVADASAKTRD